MDEDRTVKVLESLDRRVGRIEQILPTLARREETQAAIKEAVAPLATRDEVHAIVGEEGERTRRYFDIVAEGLRGDIRLIAEGHETLRTSIVETRQHLEAADARLDARVTALEASQKRSRIPR